MYIVFTHVLPYTQNEVLKITMIDVIFFSDNENTIENDFVIFENYRLHRLKKIRNIVLKLIENNNINFIICDPDNSEKSNIELIETAVSLNPALTVILFRKNKITEVTCNNTECRTMFIEKMEEIKRIEDFRPEHLRNFKRINWPLSVKYSHSPEMGNPDSGKLISLSAGGAYIETKELDIISPGSKIFIEIEFKQFNFYADASILRINHIHQQPEKNKGFAVEFQNVTQATQNCIDSIIKDKLAQKLLI